MCKPRLKVAPLVLLLLSLLAVILISREAVAQPGYRTYHNARFDYSISYPVKVLIPQGEAANGDGQKFLSKDGHTEMLVYGANNALDQTLRQVYQSEISNAEHPNRTVTYQVLRADWFVVSGIENGRVFYQRRFCGAASLRPFGSNTTKRRMELSIKSPQQSADHSEDRSSDGSHREWTNRNFIASSSSYTANSSRSNRRMAANENFFVN